MTVNYQELPFLKIHVVEVLGQYQTNEQEVVYMIRNLQTIQQTNVLHALDSCDTNLHHQVGDQFLSTSLFPRDLCKKMIAVRRHVVLVLPIC